MTAEILSLVPKKKIYGPIASAIAIILGGPIAGAYIANRNQIIFRREISKRFIVIISMILVLVIIYIDLGFPMRPHLLLYHFLLNVLLNGLILSQNSKDKLQ